MRFVFAACLAEAAVAGGDLSSHEQKTPRLMGIQRDGLAWNRVAGCKQPLNNGYFLLPGTVRPGKVHGLGKCRRSSNSYRARGS
jgi:hypothetical protein